MKEEKEYQAIMVKKETHQKVKIRSAEEQLTMDELINHLLTNKE